MKLRYSKQRELILMNIQNRCDHPTAEMIYYDLKDEEPQLSLGTVYRNLNQLVEHKFIKKLDLGHGKVHYDGNLQPHMHYVCDCCDTVYDYMYDYNDYLNHLKQHIDHDIHEVDIIMSGTCKNCQKQTS